MSVLLTWPLILHPMSQIPLGSESSPTVPLFNLWTMGWNAHWVANSFSGYWDAPIFHPVAGSFAFSDPQPLTGLLGAAVWWASPPLALNMVLLLFLTLNGLAAQRFLLARGAGRLPSLLAGVLAQFLPFLTQERGVLQLQAVFGPIWAAHCFWKLTDRPCLANGIGLGLASGVTFLTSQYYALFLVFFLLPAPLFAFRKLMNRRLAAPILLAAVLAGLLVIPVLAAQRSYLQEMGFQRDSATVAEFSAFPSDYVRHSPLLLASRLLGSDRTTGGNPLCPGFFLSVLAFLGAWFARARTGHRPIAMHLSVAGVLAFLLSLGLNLNIGAWQPYETLRQVAPGMEYLRSPFRFGVIVQVSIVLLAGLGIAALLERFRRRWILTLAALALLEQAPVPAPLVLVPPFPVREGLHSPAVVIPYAEGVRTKDYFRTVAAMCLLLPSGIRLVNGYSGYFPQWNGQLRKALDDFPTRKGLTVLRALGVRSVFLEASTLNAAAAQRLEKAEAEGELELEGFLDRVTVISLKGAAFRPAAEYDGAWQVDVQALGSELELTVSPLELGSEVYVLAPRTAPLEWEVRLTEQGGGTAVYTRRPRGSYLLQDFEPKLKIWVPRPSVPGAYLLQLARPGSREVVAETRFQL